MGTETATVLDLDDNLIVSDGVDMETDVVSWDQELHDLVHENADVIIICPWQNNEEVALSPAMFSIPIEFIPENLSLLIAEVHQMLANRVVKIEDEQEEEKSPKEESSKAKETISTAKEKPEPVPQEKEKTVAEPVVVVEPPTEVITTVAQDVSEKSGDDSQTTPESVEVVRKEAKASVEVITVAPVVKKIELDRSPSPALPTVNAKPQLPVIEIPKKPVVENMEAAVEPTIEPTATEHELEVEQTRRDPEAVTEAITEILAEIAADDLSAEETLITSQFDNASSISEHAEIADPLPVVEISVDIEEVEDTVDLLAERIKSCDQETTDKVYEILDKIIELPARLDVNGEDIEITEAEAQEKLEELFTELLDELEIDYTPELVESLARITLKWHLVEEFEDLKAEDKKEEETQGKTTHDAIIKQLAGLKDLKKAIIHAYAIGKSALHLYKLSFAK